MRRRFQALIAVALLSLTASAARGQAWNDSTARALVERAAARRAAQLSDSGLAGYKARARGTLEFLGQLGDSSLVPPRILRVAELAVDVYWTAPNISRQVVVGKRDTSLVPMDIQFYSDRYGVVESNFPDRIRLGDGKDVADVPHPVSTVGLSVYEYALGDSLRLAAGGTRRTLYQVKFRPRDTGAAAAVGAVYIDRTTADIVRMDLTFTRHAILDKRIDALSVVLENALIDGRYWLPQRQELDVERSGTVLDFPARGIVRGRWTICCYDLTPAAARAALMVPSAAISYRSAAQLRAFVFDDSLFADLRVPSAGLRSEDVERVQAVARAAVAHSVLDRIHRAAFAASGVSDFARFDRAEGLALGGGATVGRAVGDTRMELRGTARYGFDDRRLKGDVALTTSLDDGVALRLFAAHAYRDVADVAETSRALNSITAQEFGADYTDPYDVRSVGVGASFGRRCGVLWRVETAAEREGPLEVRATPVAGQFRPLPPALPVHGLEARLFADGVSFDGPGATSIHASGTLRGGDLDLDEPTASSGSASRFVHGAVEASVERSSLGGSFAARTNFAAVTFRGAVLPQQLVYFGGPTTGPGYTVHEFVGRAALSQRLEWSHTISALPIPLGSFGAMPALTALIPFAHVVWVDGPAGAPARRRGWYPSVGIGAGLFSGVLRADVARGLRGGRWTFAIDAARTLWGIL